MAEVPKCPVHDIPDCSPMLNGCAWRPTETPSGGRTPVGGAAPDGFEPTSPPAGPTPEERAELGRAILDRLDLCHHQYAGEASLFGDAANTIRRLLADLSAAEEARDLLAKAMWEARCWLGFDPDGDGRFHSTNWAQIAELHIREAQEVRSDLESAMGEVEAAEAKVAAVERLLTGWEAAHTHLGIERGNWGPPSSALRAALRTDEASR